MALLGGDLNLVQWMSGADRGDFFMFGLQGRIPTRDLPDNRYKRARLRYTSKTYWFI